MAVFILTALSSQADEMNAVVDSQNLHLLRVQSELSSTDFQSFLKTRADFLKQAKKALQALKYSFGVGVVIKNHFQFRAEKKTTL